MANSFPVLGRPTGVRWLVFALACAVSWLLYLHRYSWGVIKGAYRQDFPDVTYVELGRLDAAFTSAYALGQVPAGMAGDYFGPRGVLGLIILLWSLAVAGIAWSGSFGMLAAVLFAFGLAQAGAYPALNKVTRNWFPVSIRTSVQGVVTAFGRIGAACCGPLVATLLMGMLGVPWRTALVLIAFPGVLLAVAFWLFVRNTPREQPACNQAEQELIASGTAPVAAGPRGRLLLDRGGVFNLAMILVYSFASTFQDQLYVNWIALFLTEGHGLSQGEMGLFTPLPLIGGAVGGIVGGLLNDYLFRKTGNRRWSRSSIAFTGKLLAAGFIVLSLQVADGRLAMVVLLAARVFGDWSLPTLWGTITDMAGRASATVFGLINAVGAVGGAAGGLALGALKQYYGWDGLFLGAAAMCFLAALTWLFIDCTRRLVPD